MKHRNLKNEEWTRMAIDSLFERGVRQDWEEFVAVMKNDILLAKDTLHMCEHHSNRESVALARVLVNHFHKNSDDMSLK